MKIGLVGLGKMGAAIAQRLLDGKHDVVGFDPSKEAREAAADAGAATVTDLAQLPKHTRIFWIMVPAGKPVDEVITTLLPALQTGDIIIDGGNSHFPDSVRRYKELKEKNIHFIDCGVSGGLKGREIGFSLMIGGDKDIFEKLSSVFSVIAAPNGFGYMGPAGAGHYVKMVHNGVEYALLQAYAEGFHLLREGEYKDLDLAAVAEVWAHGSIIRSWIAELCRDIFTEDQYLKDVSGHIDENLTGRWTFDEAQKQNIPAKLIGDALDMRAWSRETGGNFSTKVVAMLRNKFGGHAVKKT